MVCCHANASELESSSSGFASGEISLKSSQDISDISTEVGSIPVY